MPGADTGPVTTSSPELRATRRHRQLTALFPWRGVVLPWLVSRVLSAGVILGAASWPFDALRWSGFTRWDGHWYTAIARLGYGAPPIANEYTRWPFFPGLPGVMRGLGDIGLPDQEAAIVLDLLVLLVAFAGIHRLTLRHGTPRAASLAVWSIALFPASFVFSMLYPSSIFLAATVWAFVLVDERRDLAAGAAAAVATLARPNGLLIVIPLMIAAGGVTWPVRLRTIRVRRAVLVAAPGVVAFGAWCGWLWDRTGDPFVFWSTKSAWPEVSLMDLLTDPLRYDGVWVHALLALVALGVVWHERRRLPLAWLVWAALVLLPSFAVGAVGLGRYANECFPPFIAAGRILDRMSRRWVIAVFTAAVLGLCFAGVAVVRYPRVP